MFVFTLSITRTGSLDSLELSGGIWLRNLMVGLWPGNNGCARTGTVGFIKRYSGDPTRNRALLMGESVQLSAPMPSNRIPREASQMAHWRLRRGTWNGYSASPNPMFCFFNGAPHRSLILSTNSSQNIPICASSKWRGWRRLKSGFKSGDDCYDTRGASALLSACSLVPINLRCP